MTRKLALFTFIDAFGWELFKSYGEEFLPEHLETTSPLGTIFGYSSTCDPTIISGRLPQEHGHFSFYAYDPARSPFRYLWPLRFLPKSLASRGRVRHHISRLVKKLLGYTGYFQLYAMPFELLPYFDYTEKRDLYEPGGLNSGHPTIFDALRKNDIPFYLSDWRAPEEKNLASLRHDLDEGQIRFAYLYMAAMDAILHRDGTHAPSAPEKIRWYGREMRRVLDLAHRKYDEVALFVFADHGMTNIHSLCPLMERIQKTGLSFGRDYAAVYDSTMARFWFLRPHAREAITEALSQEPRGRILDDETLFEWGTLFPDRRYGELFFLLNPGVLLCPSHLGVKPMKGMHGYDPYDKDSVAFFGSNLPMDSPPKWLPDLYALMLAEVR